MKLPFFRRTKSPTKVSSDEFHVVVFLSDWCPACLEYKVVLNKIVSNHHVKIDFAPPSRFNIRTIPSTLFMRDKSTKIREGFMTCEQFMHEYIEFREENI